MPVTLIRLICAGSRVNFKVAADNVVPFGLRVIVKVVLPLVEI